MLIGLAGISKQCGKSEVVYHLKKHHGFISTEMSDAICIIAEKFFGYDNDKKSEEKHRRILQNIGYAAKQMDSTIWIYHALGLARRRKWGLPIDGLISTSFLYYYHIPAVKKEIQEKGIDEFMEGSNIVIGGIRSPEEANEILKIGGKVYLVSRGEQIDSDHKVESELIGYENFTGIIDNNGSLDDLYKKYWNN
jgi:hypothetical protein